MADSPENSLIQKQIAYVLTSDGKDATEPQILAESSLATNKDQGKAVYAITSSGCDFFSAMTRVSVASLKISNPQLTTIVVCDPFSAKAMQEKHDPILEEIDQLLIVETPEGNAVFRNRHIKTRLRQLIEGPFLFLDSDTCVRGDLSSIFLLNTDIAGARNHSKSAKKDQIFDGDLEILERMNWSFPEDGYVNGGILYYNNTPGAYHFAEVWHQKWLQSWHSFQYYRDQPSLNSSLQETGVNLEILSDKFNAQFVTETSVAKDAIIWHYYSSMKQPSITAFSVLVNKLLEGQNIETKEIINMINCYHPWRRDIAWLDNWVADSILKKGRLDMEDIIWLEGNRWLSFRSRFGKYRSNKVLKIVKLIRIARSSVLPKFFGKI